MPNIQSTTMVTIDFAGVATLRFARRPASRVTFGRGKARSWFDAPVLFKASDSEGNETINPPWLLRVKLFSSWCWCTGSIGFTPTIRPLLSWIPFFWRAFRASQERYRTTNNGESCQFQDIWLNIRMEEISHNNVETLLGCMYTAD